MGDDKQPVKAFLEFIYKTHKYVEAGNVSYPMVQRDKINPVFKKIEQYLWHRQNCNALEEFNAVGYKHIRINELAKCDCFQQIKDIIYEIRETKWDKKAVDFNIYMITSSIESMKRTGKNKIGPLFCNNLIEAYKEKETKLYEAINLLDDLLVYASDANLGNINIFLNTAKDKNKYKRALKNVIKRAHKFLKEV